MTLLHNGTRRGCPRCVEIPNRVEAAGGAKALYPGGTEPSTGADAQWLKRRRSGSYWARLTTSDRQKARYSCLAAGGARSGVGAGEVFFTKTSISSYNRVVLLP